MRVYSNHRLTLPLPAGHRFPIGKYSALHRRVAAECPRAWLAQAGAASDDELALAHTPAYIAAVAEGRLTAAAQREIGLPWSAQLVARSRHSVGATLAAARAALAEGVALQLGGGTHHAYADHGAGFCVFNDVAVAARVLQAEHARRAPGAAALRLWVIDLDVHQGNGSAAIFRGDPTLFTLSLHGAHNFPLRKEPSDLDVDLPDGCGDAAYLAALDAALAQAWRRQQATGAPDLAFYLAGADPHEGDRLGRLKLSAAGLAERDRRVFDFLHARRLPVAVTMAGGYGHDLAVTVGLQLTTVRLALAAWAAWRAMAR